MSLIGAALLLSVFEARAPRLLAPFDPTQPLGAAVAQTDLVAHAARVQALMQAAPRDFPARGLLPLTRMSFGDPWRLPEIAEFAAHRAANGSTPIRCVAAYAATAFGTEQPPTDGQGTLAVSDPQRAIVALDFLLNESSLLVKNAMARCDPTAITPERVVAAVDAALNSTDRSAPRTEALLTTLAAANAVDRAVLVKAVVHFNVDLAVTGNWRTFEPEELPEDLRGAVEGHVLLTRRVDEVGWVVVGSMDANRYDMTRIAAVFDPGGNDTYAWHGTVAGSRIVVDAAGNDTYTADGFGGPGGAVLGVSLVLDAAGDDHYTGNAVALGAAAFGVGILVDRAGNDTYTAERWSIGAAFAGVGALVDLAGVDLYDSPLFSEGVGGPCGAGLLLDASGDDRYRADRSIPSAYDTPATFLAFSQGCAFGYRVGAAGGLGALVDLGGNDRYECGEFGQGCGYYLGLGVLYDASGDDFYTGNRYSQGTAAHYAFGVLVDASGNDIYHGVMAANQGGAWDVSAAMLVDRGGNDVYYGGSLSQGAAAQQALGVLVDLGGDDRYTAAGASQGSADGNDYHWEATHSPSFGLLWDVGGRNWFSSGREDGQCSRTGTDTAPEGLNGRTQWGLFLTR